MNIPLLLTGTIDASVYNNVGNRIQDVNIRLNQYENVISRYIEESPFTHIVFIENSGYKFDYLKFVNLALLHHKRFEFISGSICVDEVIKHGKSYGDAFLIHESLIKSELLKEFDFFYKITGRIYLVNAERIVKTINKYRNEFIVYTGMGWCFTNIFKVNKADYIRVLDDIYNECDELSVNDIEISFYNRLSLSDLKVGSFEVYPYFDGIMGATLKNYSGGVLNDMLET